MKGKKKSFLIGLISGILLLYVVVMVTRYFGVSIFPSWSAADDVWTRARVVESYIDRYYWKDEVSDKELSEYAAKGMVAALDDQYSAYYTEDELEESLSNVEGDYDGIGATLRLDAETNDKIVEVVQEDGPADEAGLEVGDIIKKVNDTSVQDMSLSDTVDLIKGEAGKKSVLTVERTVDDETVTKEITVVCETIVTQTVTSKMIDQDVGYIAISSFTKETVDQFTGAIDELDNKGASGLVIDLRDNGGGSLSAAVDMLDRMLPAGDLITEENKVKGDKLYTSTDDTHYDDPVVILINANSASASEVFAGCMQERGAATLVGVQSFGKGIVQTIFSFPDTIGGGIKLTTGEYLLPSGRCIQDEGLTPDVEVEYEGSSDKLGGEDDNQLQKACEELLSALG